MRFLEAEVLALRTAEAITPKELFAIQRWVELLDLSTPLGWSAYARLSPIEAVEEATYALQTYEQKPYLAAGIMMGSVRRLAAVIRDDESVFSDKNFPGLQNHVVTIESELAKVDKADGDGRPLVMTESAAVINEHLLPIHAAIRSNYLEVCEQQLDRHIASSFEDIIQLQRLDRAVMRLAVEFIRRGHDEQSAYRRMLDELGKGSRPAQIIKDLIHAEKAPYEVAVVIDRVRRINSTGLPSTLRFQDVIFGREKWPAGTVDGEDRLLKDWCRDHWSSSSDKSRKCVVKVIAVDAFDSAGAREEALRQAELLVDLLNAGNRRHTVGVKRKVLVHDVSTGRCEGMRGDCRVRDSLAPIRLDSSNEVSGALRFYSRGRLERNATVASLFYWIALESFYSQGGDAPKKVFLVVPRIASRSVIRDLVGYSRTILKVLIGCLGDAGVSLGAEGLAAEIASDDSIKWTTALDYLLRSHPESIMSVREAPLYLRYSLANSVKTLANSDRLRNHAAGFAKRVDWGLKRAYMNRNQMVHAASESEFGGLSLEVFLSGLVDSCFEVLSLWMRWVTPDPRGALDGFSEEYAGSLISAKSFAPRDLMGERLFSGIDDGRRPGLAG